MFRMQPGARRLCPTLGLVLSGGLARRMGGGDKALIDEQHDRAQAVIARLTCAWPGLILNADGDTGPLCPLRPADHRRQRAGFRRPTRRHSGRAR